MMSSSVTMACAGPPDPPPIPTLILGTRDIISVKWESPQNNGGSPVLGFFVYMKSSTADDFILVQDGGEDPTLLTFSTTKD
jgi:hypothetical protein